MNTLSKGHHHTIHDKGVKETPASLDFSDVWHIIISIDKFNWNSIKHIIYTTILSDHRISYSMQSFTYV